MDAKKIQDIPLSVGTQDRLDVGVEREDDLKGRVCPSGDSSPAITLHYYKV